MTYDKELTEELLEVTRLIYSRTDVWSGAIAKTIVHSYSRIRAAQIIANKEKTEEDHSDVYS